MGQNERDIAVRMGRAFATIVERFLPAVTEAVARTEKEISFGATVRVRIDKRTNTVVGKLHSHEPKIPTEGIEPMPFVLNREPSGQLSFLFDGTLEELEAVARQEPEEQ